MLIILHTPHGDPMLVNTGRIVRSNSSGMKTTNLWLDDGARVPACIEVRESPTTIELLERKAWREA